MNHWLRSAAERGRRSMRIALAATLLATTLLPYGATAQPAEQADPRFFAQTNFRIDHDPFWDYFQRRGGVRTFGYPVSNNFLFLGCTVQFFQRLIMQQCGPTGGVGTLNLLDAGLLPYTRINGSTFPGSDPKLIGSAPSPSDPEYASKVVQFVQANAPDEFEGQPVNFFQTFMNTVTLDEAFPNGDGDPDLLPLVNLELWGMPTSSPQRDPNNFDFIYQRFQRGIMHYDKSCQCTQGLLLADYLKSVLTGQNLPADLDQQARTSPLYKSAAGGANPAATNFQGAFTAGASAPPVASQPPAPQQPAPQPAPPPAMSGGVAQFSPSPDYGLSMFIWGQSSTTGRDLKLAQDAGFHWQKTLFQWRLIEKAKGVFDWSEADRVVKASNAAGIKTIARLDLQPGWTGVPETLNGPPLNYQDYYDFISAFVSHYKSGSPNGHVEAIEVWNEPNLDREWGGNAISAQSAADYVRLLTGAYQAAKAADPNVIVISAGLSPTGVTNEHSADDVTYLQWLFAAGLKGGVNYDVLGAHGNTQAPCVECDLNSLPNFPHPSFYFRRVEQLRDVQVKNGDSDRQIWLLEFGWTSDQIHPNYSWFAVSEDQKAQNIVKAFQYARTNWSPWMGVMTLWTFSDPFWTSQREEYWWAITNPDETTRPAYNEFKNARQSGALP